MISFQDKQKEVNSSFVICICKWKGILFTIEGTGLSHTEQTARETWFRQNANV